ncbi:hypothetical protein [Mycoplasma elephantis]|uniref:TMEM164 family acyltransferase n=1 Tax=Mycoplasma elephantis TaxID=114882 RepID=UPI000488AF68|nr:hypothetical protein [Mycoplasma elephantis]
MTTSNVIFLFDKNKLFSLLNKQFNTGAPTSFGLFHLIYLFAFLIISILLIIILRKPKKITVKFVFLFFYIILFTIELLKQIYSLGKDFTSFKNNPEFFPLVLCSMPLYIIPIFLLIPLKYEKASNAILSYLSIFNLWCGLFVMLYPGDVFISNIFISNHTMIYHGILMALGIWTCFNRIVKFHISTFIWAAIIFIIEYILICIGNEVLYHIKDNINFYPNLFNISHRRPSPMFSNIPYIKDLKPWIVTILYIPTTLCSAFIIYTLVWSISLPFDLMKQKNKM